MTSAPPPLRGTAPGRVVLHDLTFVEDGDQVIIGRPDIDSFAVFPPDAASVLRRLRAGEDTASVAAWYEAAYGEPADIDDFVTTLHDLGFVRPDGDDSAPSPAARPLRWQRLGTAVFSVPALALYAMATGAAVYLMVASPALRPYPSNAFFTRSLLVVLFATTLAQFAGIALHEWFHVLAGQRLGLAAKVSLGRRLYFVVFQTTLLGIMGVPSRKRILPFLAGLIADALVICALTGFAEAVTLAGWPSWLSRAAVSFAYVTVLRMLWQALIFLETDLHHVLASALRCPGLSQMTGTYLRNQVRRARRRPVLDLADLGWTDRDLRTVRRFAPFAVAGSVAIIGLTAASLIPFLLTLGGRTYHGLVTGGLASPGFWDSLTAGLLVLSPFTVTGYLAFRDHRRRPAAQQQ